MDAVNDAWKEGDEHTANIWAYGLCWDNILSIRDSTRDRRYSISSKFSVSAGFTYSNEHNSSIINFFNVSVSTGCKISC